MTLITAWVRKNENLRELVIASDSCIGGGERWDVCPKIIALPRPATVIAMSGDATPGYAFVYQALNTCHLLEGHKVGRTDLCYLARKLRATYADLRNYVRNLPSTQEVADVPEINVALYGWSWRNLAFEGYSYSYDKNGVLRMASLGELNCDRAYPLHLMGDAAKDARRRIAKLMKKNGLEMPRRRDPEASKFAVEAFLNWEPLQALVDVSRDKSVTIVGGGPAGLSYLPVRRR